MSTINKLKELKGFKENMNKQLNELREDMRRTV